MRVVDLDVSEVGHAQAIARARDAGLGQLVQFQHGDIATVTLPEGTFDGTSSPA